MLMLIGWILCVICTYLLMKSHLENLFRPLGGLPSVCRKLWLNDPENTDEDRFLLQGTSDNLISAILWTLLLIVCIFLWSGVLLQLVYWMIIKPDVTEFEEMHK